VNIEGYIAGWKETECFGDDPYKGNPPCPPLLKGGWRGDFEDYGAFRSP
jgi:hypothetical protein